MTGDLDKQRQSILIVDDTPEILKFLMKAFSDLEYIVRLASSGNMVFNAIETDPPDLILLDINMPGMDGYEVCQRLKTSEEFREIPVIFLTARQETIDKVKAFEAGGVDYITKPFHIKEVLSRVITHLDIRNLQKQLGKQNLQLEQQIIVCRQTEEELRKHKIYLEELVEERTADLRKINVVLQKEITEREKAAEELKFRNIILSTQQEVSADGILVINEKGHILSCNRLFIDMWGIPQDVIEKRSDERALQSVLDKLSNSEEFISRVKYLYEHVKETSSDEIELLDGRIFDRYSAPMIGSDEKNHGRVWFFRDITDRKATEKALEKREAELENKSTSLEEMNAALKILLKERESDKIELEEKILSNVKELVFPYIEKLKRSRLDSQYMTFVDIIETNLKDIVSPFLQKMGLKYANLTPTEIEIASLIKNGKRTKEIGELLHMSPGAINFHRNNIRKKLGLNNEKVNLRSYLMSI